MTWHFLGGKTVGEAASSAWTESLMKMAQRELEVPKGTKILLFSQEIFDRDILSPYSKQFGYKYPNAGGKAAQMGYKMPCPYCSSNKFLHSGKETGYKSRVRSRV
jgi:hypothetical protein